MTEVNSCNNISCPAYDSDLPNNCPLAVIQIGEDGKCENYLNMSWKVEERRSSEQLEDMRRMVDRDTWTSIKFLIGAILLFIAAFLIAFGLNPDLESNKMWIAGLICVVIGIFFWMSNIESEHERFERMRL